MKVVKKPLLALLSAVLSLPAGVFAHPGHEHADGIPERIHHAIIGWDQLVILLIIGGVAAVWFSRRSK